jgi:hypothetical protein
MAERGDIINPQKSRKVRFWYGVSEIALVKYASAATNGIAGVLIPESLFF